MVTTEENRILITPVYDRGDLAALVPRWRALLEYDSQTGVLLWRHRGEIGPQVATKRRPKKRGFVKIDGIRVPSSHAVWLVHHGRWPDHELKPRDDDLTNDRIENLEPSDKEPRKRLRPIGVARYGARWQAYYRDDYGQKHLGVYDTEAEAVAARAAYEQGFELPKRRGKRPLGVARCGDRWQAYAKPNGVQKHLGVFDTEAEAIAARAAYDRGDDLV